MKIMAVIVGAVIGGAFLFAAVQRGAIQFDLSILQLGPSKEQQEEMQRLQQQVAEYEETINQLSELLAKSELQVGEAPPPPPVVSTISIVNVNTNEPVQDVWIYVGTDDVGCITGVEGTFCVQRNPDCITDASGTCSLEFEAGEYTLLLKTVRDGETIFSRTERISVSAEDPDVTVRILKPVPVAFEVQTEDLGVPLDGAEIHVDGEMLGVASTGRLSWYLQVGPHDVLVKYKNPFGRVVTSEAAIDVEERLDNKFVLKISVLTLEELRDYTLSLINAEREKLGLRPLLLVDSGVAQRHAEEMAAEGYLSHWDTAGLKPYMRYTLSGGLHAVSENVALERCDAGKQQCITDPVNTIRKLHDGLMQTTGSSRADVVNRWHTGVSIGVAYNSGFVALVQDFESNHVLWDRPMTVGPDGVLSMSGQIVSRDLAPVAVAVYHDELPLKQAPEILAGIRSGTAYDRGVPVTTIDPSSFEGVYRHVPESTMPGGWEFDVNGVFAISFPLTKIMLSSHTYSSNGIYTVYLFAKSSAGELVPLTNYSVRYADGLLSTMDGSELWRCDLIPKHRC